MNNISLNEPIFSNIGLDKFLNLEYSKFYKNVKEFSIDDSILNKYNISKLELDKLRLSLQEKKAEEKKAEEKKAEEKKAEEEKAEEKYTENNQINLTTIKNIENIKDGLLTNDQDIQFIKKIIYNDKHREYLDYLYKISVWYNSNKSDIDHLFNNLIACFKNQKITFNTNIQEIYDDFVEYMYNETIKY